MNIKRTALTTAIVGLFATTALSAQAQEPMVEGASEAPAFEEIDTNADGAITTSEAQGSWLAGVFATVDVNQDGFVTRTEYNEARS